MSESSTPREPQPGWGHRVVVGTVVLASLAMLVPGVWAWADPMSFADATNWPRHVHFLHDAGAFQIGIGLTLLCALRWRDVIAVVLAGFTFTNTLHTVNHVMDLALGGRSADPYGLGAVSVLAAVGLGIRLHQLRRVAHLPPREVLR